MSDNMGERMAKIEQKVDGLNNKVDELKFTLGEFIKASDARYASKKVEDWFVWMGRIVIGAVIVALLSLVIINFK